MLKMASKQHTTKLNEYKGLKYLTFPQLDEPGVVDHMFSTRIGGVSKGPFSECNLSYTRGDDPEAVNENFRRISEAMGHGRSLSDFVLTYQTHTTNIRVVTEDDRGKGPAKKRDYTDIDGLITDVPGIILGTFHADCPPIYFVDKKGRAIGLSHSGWKGTQGKIAKKTVQALYSNYGVEAGDLVCAIGPSICGDCYEIGSDVADEFSKAFSEKELRDYHILIPYPEGKYRLFLWNAIRLTLIQAGVKESDIIVTDLCTRCNPDIFFSHRVHGEKRGNLCAFLSLRQK